MIQSILNIIFIIFGITSAIVLYCGVALKLLDENKPKYQCFIFPLFYLFFYTLGIIIFIEMLKN